MTTFFCKEKYFCKEKKLLITFSKKIVFNLIKYYLCVFSHSVIMNILLLCGIEKIEIMRKMLNFAT